MPVTDRQHPLPLARAIGSGLHLLSPAVLCAQPGSPAAALTARVGRRTWPTVVHDEATRAVHAASVRDPRLVLVGGTTFAWVHHAVRMLRASGSFPLAVVASETTSDETLTLLRAGATTVIEPAADSGELVARLTALVRGAGTEAPQVRWLQADGMRLDLGARRCTLDGEQLRLSATEFDLLAYLMAHAQRAVPTTEIVHHVWGWNHGDGANTVRIHIARLRRKLGDDVREPRWIGSSRSVGYEFLPAVAELGEDRSEERLRQSVAALNAQGDALAALVDTLAAAGSPEQVAEVVVQWAVTRGFADAATVFRLDADARGVATSTLVASAGMSARWRQAIATGHPVSDGFLGAHVYASGEVVQLADMTRLAKRFPVTARMSTSEDLHACVLFPLLVDGSIWGDLAFLSRATRAFTPARSAFLRTVAGVVSLAVAASTRPGPADA